MLLKVLKFKGEWHWCILLIWFHSTFPRHVDIFCEHSTTISHMYPSTQWTDFETACMRIYMNRWPRMWGYWYQGTNSYNVQMYECVKATSLSLCSCYVTSYVWPWSQMFADAQIICAKGRCAVFCCGTALHLSPSCILLLLDYFHPQKWWFCVMFTLYWACATTLFILNWACAVTLYWACKQK